ncbi:MAG: rhomboid family intramembrane serine protease [Ferruginibacter sp.]
MNTYNKKLKHILPTFFTINIVSVFALLFIRWICTIQFSIIDIREDIWDLFIPIIFPWISITLWLRQRFRILTFTKYQDRRQFGFQIISWMTMAATLCISQAYFTTATGKLEIISNVKQIDKVEKVRYYKINKFFVQNNFSSAYTYFNTSGKYSQYLNIDVFFVSPILPDSSEEIPAIPKTWYAKKYHKQISNKISNKEKDDLYDAFYNESEQNYNEYNYYSLDHFERIPASEDKTYFLKAVEVRIKEKTNNSFIILQPVDEPYEKRNGNKLAWIFGAFGIGLTILLLLLMWPGYSEVERGKLLTGKKPKQDDLFDTLKYLIPKGDHFATSVILDLNILVFLVMMFSGVNIISPNGRELLLWGGNRRHEVLNGEYWRLLTNIFLHGGVMHLVVNIYGLILGALFVEPLFKAKKFFILYILSGICASLASIYWHTNTVSVGASGGIFGLYGAILGLLLINAYDKQTKKGLFTMIGLYVGINLLWGLTGGIDNAAHIGGLVSGALIGIILYKLNGSREENEL